MIAVFVYVTLVAVGSSASEHEASDIEESSSPVKKRPAVLDSDDEEPEIDKSMLLRC